MHLSVLAEGEAQERIRNFSGQGIDDQRQLPDTSCVKAGPSPTARALLFVACALLIMARVSGTHLHLCFDGGEPRSSVHLVEDGNADFHFGANGSHADLDVSVVGNVLVKQDTLGVNLLPILIAAAIVLGLVRRPSRWIGYSARKIPVPTPLFELLPPPHGPPV